MRDSTSLEPGSATHSKPNQITAGAESLSDEEKELVSLVVDQLYELFTRKRWFRISIRQWINRLLLLYQRPLTILVYQRTKGRWSGRWARAFHSHRDYAYHERFESFLEGFHEPSVPFSKEKTEQRVFCLKEGLEPHPIPLPKDDGNEFGLLLIGQKQILKNPGLSLHSPNVDFCLLRPSDGPDHLRKEYVFLDALWSRFLGTRYAEHVGVVPRMLANLEDIFETNTNIEAPELDELPKFGEGNLFLDGENQNRFLEEQIDLIRNRVVKKIYETHARTPLISPDGTPQNIFVYMRYYGPDETRNRSSFSRQESRYPYPFSLRLMLPDAQVNDLRHTFEQIRDEAERCDGGKTWKYVYYDINKEPPTRKEKPLKESDVRGYADWFWTTLKKERGIDYLIAALMEARGQGTRSMADPALSAGFLHFRPGLFTQNFYVYLSEDEVSKGVEHSADLQRAVIMHYLFSAATASREVTLPLGAMIMPLRVGTRSWMAFVHITAMEEAQGGDERPEAGRKQGTEECAVPSANCTKHHEQALHNIYLYSAVQQQAVQRIREAGKREYLKQIEEIFTGAVKAWLDGDYAMARLDAIVNERFNWLCRVWPFPLIAIQLRRHHIDSDEDTEFNVLPFLEKGKASYSVSFRITESNPYYRHELLHSVSGSGKQKASGIHAPGLEDFDKPNRGYLSAKDVKNAFVLANTSITQHVHRAAMKKLSRILGPSGQ